MRAQSNYVVEVFDGTHWTQGVQVVSLKSAIKMLHELHHSAPERVHRLMETIRIERCVLKGDPLSAPRGKPPAVIYRGKPGPKVYNSKYRRAK